MEEEKSKEGTGQEIFLGQGELKASKTDHGDVTDSDDDSFFVIDCDLCRKEFTNVKMYEQHLKSKKHYKMMTKKKLMQKVGKHDKLSLEVEDDTATEMMDEISCDVCTKSFSGYVPYAAHLNSNAHFKNLKREQMKETMKDLPQVIGIDDVANGSDDDVFQKPFASCTQCAKVFHDPQALQNHLRGATHKKTTQKEKIIENLKSQRSQNAEGSDLDEEFYTACELCSKSFSGPVPFEIHLNSTAHKKEVKRSKAEEALTDYFTKDRESRKLICKECGKMFTDPFSLKIHLNSGSHEKQKAKDEMLNFTTAHPEIIVVKSIQNCLLDEGSDDDGVYNIGFNFLVCKLCHMSFSGPENAEEHVKSKKHIQVKMNKAAKKFLLKKLKATKAEEKSNGVSEANPSGNVTDIKETSTAGNIKNEFFKCTPV